MWWLRNKQAEMMLELNQPVTISYVVSFILNKATKAENMNNKELDSVIVNQDH